MVTRRDEREHHPAAEPVGQRTDHDPAQRADDHRHRDQQRHVGLAERTEGPLVAEQRAERADQRPGPEVDREPEGRHAPASATANRPPRG